MSTNDVFFIGTIIT